MKKLFLLFSILLSLLNSFSQDYHKIDSLKQILYTLPVLDGSEDDTTRMKLSMRIAKLYERYMPDTAMFYYQSVIDTSIFRSEEFLQSELKNKKGRHTYNTNSMYLLGLLYTYRGEYPVSSDLWSKSLKIFEELNDDYGESKCLNGLGNLAWNQGNYPEAIEYLEKSLKLKEELNDKKGIPYGLNNLGLVAMYQGNYEKACEYYLKSLKIAEELLDKKLIMTCLGNLGLVLSNQGDFSGSLEYYEKSLKIAEDLNDKKQISNILGNIGNVFYNQGDFENTMVFIEKSLKLKEELKDKKGISTGFKNMGNLFYRQNEFSKAAEYYEKSLQISEELGAIANLASDYPVLAKEYIHLNKPEKAMPLLLKSNDISIYLLEDNFTILSESEKELYLNSTKAVFNDLHSFNLNFPDYNNSLPGICYNNELILKGLLLKSTSSILDIVYNFPDTELKEVYFSLKNLRNNISAMQTALISNRDSIIADLETKANEQELKLVRLSSEFAGIQNLFEYKWEDVQKNLKSGEAAIEFVSYNQGDINDTIVYAALIVTSECKMPVSVKLFKDSELQKIMGESNQTGFVFVSTLYNSYSQELYNLIWKPLEPALSGIHTVYYAPVGVLNKISFAVLSKANGKMICDEYSLYQLSTTGKLITSDKKYDINMTSAVFGGIDYNTDTVIKGTDGFQGWKYLGGTLVEKEQIEKQFRKNKISCTSFSGKEAKEENFKALFDNKDAPSILHVSTHGFFYPDPEVTRVREKSQSQSGEIKFRGLSGFGHWMFVQNKNPMMRSGLVFAGANKVWSEEWGRTDNEGVLTAFEVSNLNMRNTDLVVLSACETGLGDVKGSEGVYGLQRAFKMAGVKYIIMSLWQVPDKETVEFMETFYKKLLKSKDVKMSFNETQKEMRKKYDPYYWAAFVLVE